MAVRDLVSFDMGASNPPDGTAGNLPAARQTLKGSEAAPTHFLPVAAFSPTADEHMEFGPIRLPSWFVTFQDAIVQWGANAITGAALWSVRVWTLPEGSVDTYLEHPYAAAQTGSEAANVTEARRLVETPITIANGDGAAPGRMAMFRLTRVGSDTVTDTLAVDAEALTLTITANDA
jgi:hypothetical protein